MSYSLVEAATACGVNRSPVSRAIKAGKISAGKDEQGEWRIEAVELHRIYPPVQTHEAHSEKAHQDALIAELRTVLADTRRDRDEWREQAHRLALLAPKAEPVQPKPEPAQIAQPCANGAFFGVTIFPAKITHHVCYFSTAAALRT